MNILYLKLMKVVTLWRLLYCRAKHKIFARYFEFYSSIHLQWLEMKNLKMNCRIEFEILLGAVYQEDIQRNAMHVYYMVMGTVIPSYGLP